VKVRKRVQKKIGCEAISWGRSFSSSRGNNSSLKEEPERSGVPRPLVVGATHSFGDEGWPSTSGLVPITGTLSQFSRRKEKRATVDGGWSFAGGFKMSVSRLRKKNAEGQVREGGGAREKVKDTIKKVFQTSRLSKRILADDEG